VLEATFDSLGDVMAVVEEAKHQPAEPEQLARLGPLVLLYEVTERSPPTACSIGSSRRTAKAR
jgi:hypothetical protein